MKRVLRSACFCIAIGLGALPAYGDDACWDGGAVSKGEASQAKALLDQAAARYRAEGEKALAAISRAGEFVQGDLYVYVVGKDGRMLASGGPSLSLVGRDVRELKDAKGKPFIRELLRISAERGEGAVEYRWLNREHGKVERKVACFRQVNDVVVAVGYYIPRAGTQEARGLLARAVEAIAENPKAAFARFNDINGGFVRDDLYVLVVGLDDKVMYAHGAMPRLVGRNAEDLRDMVGSPIIREMVESAGTKTEGELEYTWPNPVTRKQERKITYWRRIGSYLVAVGRYMPLR